MAEIVIDHECDEGQLCPYDDCAWYCGFSEEGWYICPNCHREFYAVVTESDFEDFHTYYLNDGWGETPPPKPNNVPLARDCGRSWGTPEGNPAGGGK